MDTEQKVLQPIEILLSPEGVAAEIAAGRDGRRRKIFWLSLPANHPMVTLDADGRPVVGPQMIEAADEPPYWCEHPFRSWPTVKTMLEGVDARQIIMEDGAALLARDRSDEEKLRSEADENVRLNAAELYRTQQEQSAWIKKHGAFSLVQADKEGIDCRANYIAARLALEMPGWKFAEEFEAEGCGLGLAGNPNLDDIELLAEAREHIPTAELVKMITDNGEGLHVATAQWMGQPVVYAERKATHGL